MKKVTNYFGNRFKSSLRGFRSRAKKQLVKSTAALAITSEFEALEGRILLSGIGTGINAKKVQFVDADGDKVLVTALGKNVTFNIDLGGATNNADIANININGNGSLGVVVTPVGSFTKPVATKPILDPNFTGLLPNPGPGGSTDYTDIKFESKIQTQYYNLTPGYTNIGSITATGVTQIGSIGLVAAVVPVIDLPGTVVGNINLSTGLVAKVDQFMATDGSYLPGYGGWIPGLGNIDLWNINAKSISGINISGIPGAGNDFKGDITVVDGIGRLTGTNSTFFGQINLTGATSTLGTVVLGGGFTPGAGVQSTGDLTFNAGGFNGILNVGGHLNLGIRGGAFSGTITATDGISGLRSVETDPLLIISDVTGLIHSDTFITDVFFSNANLTKGAIVAGTKIGNISIGAASTFTNSVIEAPTIGTISSYNGAGLGTGNSIIADNLGGLVIRNADLAAGNLIDVSGKINTIDIANGNLSANIAAGSIGSIELSGNGDGKTGNLTGVVATMTGGIDSLSLQFGNLTGTVKSAANIGAIMLTGGQLTGVVTAEGNITSVDAHWLGTGAGNAIGTGAVIHAGGNIGPISASSVNGNAIDAAFITAGGTLSSIDAESLSGLGINGLTLSSLGPITSIAGTGTTGGIAGLYALSGGNIGTVTGTSLLGTGIATSRLSATSLTNVTGNSGAGAGIVNLEITASAGGLASITGKGDLGGIVNSQITTTGSVDSVTGTATGLNFGGSGINALSIVAGTSVGAIKGTSLSANAADAGILNTTVSAGTSIGQITGTGTAGSGISGGIFVAANGDITGAAGSSTDSSSNGSGIFGAKFISQKGIVAAITGTAAGSGAGIGGAPGLETIISAQNDITSVNGTSLFGTGIEWTNIHSSYGNIGPVTGASTNDSGTGHGIANTNIDSALGYVTSVTGTASGQGPTGGDGLLNVNVFAAKADASGNLTITGNAHGGDGINGTTNVLLASGNLIVNAKTVTGTAINGASNFEATLGSVTVNVDATGKGASGINGATFTGLSIAPVNVTLASSQAGDAINNSTFTATNGAIGAITVVNNSTVGGRGISGSTWAATGGDIGAISVTLPNNGAGQGIYDSTFQSTGNITSITVNGTTGNGIEGSFIGATQFIADSDGDLAGNIGPIAVTVTGPGANGIIGTGGNKLDVQFTGSSIGKIDVNVNNAGGGSAISYATFTSTGKSTIGDITAVTKGTGNAVDAISNADFLSKGKIGNIVATTAGRAGIFVSNFTSTESSIGSITATSTGLAGNSDAIYNSNFSAAGQIGAITATTEGGSGIFGSTFYANTDGLGGKLDAGDIVSITAITNGKNVFASNAISNSQFKGANIGNIEAKVTNILGGNTIEFSTFAASVVEPDGKGNFNNVGTIGNINVSNASQGDVLAKIDANGIINSNFYAGSAGKIGDITVVSDFGSAIRTSTFDAAFYTDVDQGAFTSTIGKIDVQFGRNNNLATTLPAGITNSQFYANAGISLPDLKVSGVGAGIIGSTFDANRDFGGIDDVAGNIGNVIVTINGRNTQGINASTFTGANIGNIDVKLQNDAKTSGYAVYDSNFTAQAGNIGTVTVLNKGVVAGSGGIGASAPGNTAFTATGNIGAIAVTVDGGNGINNSFFIANVDGKAGGDLALAGITVNTNTGNGIINSNFNGANIGNIESNVLVDAPVPAAVVAIGNSNFIASNVVTAGANQNNTGSIGTITVTNASTNAAAHGIVNSTFLAGAAGKVDNIKATVAGGNAIDTTNFLATNTTGTDSLFTGTIGTVTVVNAGKVGINGGAFIAEAGIGAINVNSVGTGISGTFFSADSNADGTGNITSITVKASGVGSNGIDNAAVFTAASIGNIQVDLTATTGTGDAINNATFIASNVVTVGANKNNTGSIGTVTVANASTNAAADGIFGSTFLAGAAGKIDNIKATVAGGDAFSAANFLATTTTGTDSVLNSTIGTVTVVNAGKVGINGGAFVAEAGIGAIDVKSAGTGISGTVFNADANSDSTGGITSIKVAVSGAGSNGIGGAFFLGANIGPIQVDLSATTGTGDAINGATFIASNVVTVGANKNNTGSIGTITVSNASTDAAADGIVASTFSAGAAGKIDNIKATVAGGNAFNAANFLATSTTGTDALLNSTIGTIQALGTGTGIASLTANALGSIGLVTGTGSTADQSISLSAESVTGASFTFTAAKTATVALGASVKTAGALSVDVSGATNGNLTVTGGSAILATLGATTADGNANVSGLTLGANSTVDAINVGGTLTTGSALAGVKTLTSLKAGSLAAGGGNLYIGAGGAGSSVGSITITTDIVNAAAPPAGDRYTFRFASYTATPDATVAATAITANAAPTNTNPALGSSVGGGFWFQII